MNLAADLDEFLILHRPHGGMTPTVGELTLNGYRLELACSCGVTFERWVTAQDAGADLLRAQLGAEPLAERGHGIICPSTAGHLTSYFRIGTSR